MTADDIIAAARACLGTPFRHQGRLPGRALDCAGLIVAVADVLGVEYQDQTGYSRLPIGNLLEAALDAQPGLQRLSSITERQAGDILLMRFDTDPQHLAILAGGTVIHSYQNVGKVCEHRLSLGWAARIVRVYRFKGMA